MGQCASRSQRHVSNGDTSMENAILWGGDTMTGKEDCFDDENATGVVIIPEVVHEYSTTSTTEDLEVEESKGGFPMMKPKVVQKTARQLWRRQKQQPPPQFKKEVLPPSPALTAPDSTLGSITPTSSTSSIGASTSMPTPRFSCGSAVAVRTPLSRLDYIQEDDTETNDEASVTHHSRNSMNLAPSDEESVSERRKRSFEKTGNRWVDHSQHLSASKSQPKSDAKRLAGAASELAAAKTAPLTTVQGVTSANSIHHTPSAVLLGPLTPVKIKAARLVQPASIRVYPQNQRNGNGASAAAATAAAPESSASSSVSTKAQAERASANTAINSTASDVAPAAAVVDSNGAATTPTTSDAIAATEWLNFSKLKLQVAVSQQHSQHKRVVAKLEDRVYDVKQHQQVWQQYQQIQTIQQQQNRQKRNSKNANSNSAPLPDDEEAASCGAVLEAEFDQPLVEEKASSTSRANNDSKSKPRSRKSGKNDAKSLSLFSKKDGAASVGSKVMATAAITSDASSLSSDKRQHGRSILRPQNGKGQSSVVKKVSPRAKHVQEQSPTTAITKATSTSSVSSLRLRRRKPKKERANSFDLQQTGSWFFDFQDEFRLAEEAAAAKAAADEAQAPSKRGGGGGSCNNSQAELSLLSSASMEVQRRLFAEKQRQRQLKKAQQSTAGTSSSVVPVTPRNLVSPRIDDDTPLMSNHSRPSNNKGGDGLTDMEVAFCSPPARRSIGGPSNNSAAGGVSHDPVDNFSLVSDLDDTMSFSSLANNRHSAAKLQNNDYGVLKRPRRRAGGGVALADHSSCISEDDSSYGGGNNSNHSRQSDTQQNPNGSSLEAVFDFKSVLQRRLDIEARLRALAAMDDDEIENTDLPSQPALPKQQPGVVTDDAMGAFPTTSAVNPRVNLAGASRVSAPTNGGVRSLCKPTKPVQSRQSNDTADPRRRSLVTDGLAKVPLPTGGTAPISIVTPLVDRVKHVANGGAIRPSVHTAESPAATACGLEKLAPCNVADGVEPKNLSFESTESQGALFLSLPYLDAQKPCLAHGLEGNESVLTNPSFDDSCEHSVDGYQSAAKPVNGLDDISMVANQSISSDKFVEIPDEQIVHDGFSNDHTGAVRKKCSIIDDAHDTLQLAGQVEARVQDILTKYRRENPEN